MKTQARPINSHRLARGIRWAQAMLAWLALLLCTDIVRTDRRHIRQRYGRIRRLHQIERFLAALLINRAVEIAPLPKQPGRPSRNAAPAGFRRRLVHKPSFRVMLGSRLRKALRHRDLLQRLQRLWAAFADIVTLARRYACRASDVASPGSVRYCSPHRLPWPWALQPRSQLRQPILPRSI